MVSSVIVGFNNLYDPNLTKDRLDNQVTTAKLPNLPGHEFIVRFHLAIGIVLDVAGGGVRFSVHWHEFPLRLSLVGPNGWLILVVKDRAVVRGHADLATK